jgi:hypothetical protein
MTISTSVNPVGALDPTFNNNVGGDVALFDTKTFTGTQKGWANARLPTPTTPWRLSPRSAPRAC